MNKEMIKLFLENAPELMNGLCTLPSSLLQKADDGYLNTVDVAQEMENAFVILSEANNSCQRAIMSLTKENKQLSESAQVERRIAINKGNECGGLKEELAKAHKMIGELYIKCN